MTAIELEQWVLWYGAKQTSGTTWHKWRELSEKNKIWVRRIAFDSGYKWSSAK